jgi:hypothetical protein
MMKKVIAWLILICCGNIILIFVCSKYLPKLEWYKEHREEVETIEKERKHHPYLRKQQDGYSIRVGALREAVERLELKLDAIEKAIRETGITKGS